MNEFRSYLDELESRGHVVRITKPVEVGNELAAIQWQVERQMHKAVIFENVRGYDAQVVGNLYLLPLRMGITPTIPMMEEFLEVYASLKKPGIVYPVWAANDMWMQMYREVEEVVVNGLKNPVEPVQINNTDLMHSVTSNIDILAQLPIPKYFSQDAGHYITTGVTIARDPETKYVNAGIYRIQVIDKDKLAVMVNVKRDMLCLLNSAQRRNSKLDVAIAIGVCPQLMIAATMSAPYGQSELHVAGGLASQPLELIPGQTVDLCVPAHAEIIL